MSLETELEQRLDGLMAQVRGNDRVTVRVVSELCRWGFYGQKVFSQMGLGLSGSVFRQRPGSVQMTVKVSEGGIPLVAWVTSSCTTGCIEQMFDLLYADKLKWQKDKFPWT